MVSFDELGDQHPVNSSDFDVDSRGPPWIYRKVGFT